MTKRDSQAELQARVRLLEERVQGLRTSRRILMNLLTAQERARQAHIQRLEAENRKLQRRAGRYARALLEGNIRLVRLQERLHQTGSQA